MFSYKFYLLWSPSDNCNSLWHISDTGWTVSACKLLSYSIVKKKEKLFMTKQNVSVLWTEAVSIQVVPVNSMRWMSLIKVNLGYTFQDMVLKNIHHLSDFQLMKFLASYPTARWCLARRGEKREGGICRALQNGTLWSPQAGPGLFEPAYLEGWVSLKQWVMQVFWRVFCSLTWMLLRNRGASSRSQDFSFFFPLLFSSSPTL